MSRENVELVLRLQAASDVNLARVFRDDAAWTTLAANLAPALTRDFECMTRGFPGHEGEISRGVEGLRTVFLEWLAPWQSYRTEVEDTIDLGDRVVVLVRDFGRHTQETNEVSLRSAAVWTVHGGKIRRVEFCADRGTALKAVGLEG